MTRRARLALVAALACLLAGCALEAPVGLRSQVAVSASARAPGAEVEIVWSSNLDALEGGHRLTIVDDQVCLLSDSGYLYGLDPATGRGERTSLGEAIAAGGPCTATRAVAITAAGQLAVFERASGKASWRVPLDSNALGPPALVGGTVVTMLADGRVLAHSLASGERLWEVVTDRAPVRFKGLFRPVEVDGFDLLVYGAPAGSLVMLNTLDGVIEWSASLAAQRNVNPTANWAYIAGAAITARGVCASSFNGKMGCYDNVTGAPRWQLPQSAASPVASDGASLFLVDADGSLRSYAVNDGALRWSAGGASSKTVPLVHSWGKLVMVDGGEGFVFFHDAATGELVASNQVSGSLIDVAELGDELLVATTSGAIYRLRRG